MSVKVKFYLPEQEIASFEELKRCVGDASPLFFLIFDVEKSEEALSGLTTFLDQHRYLHLSSPILPQIASHARTIDLLVKFNDAPCWYTLFELFNAKLIEFQEIEDHGVECFTLEGLSEKWHREIESPYLKEVLEKLNDEADLTENLRLRKNLWDHILTLAELLGPIVTATKPIIDDHPRLLSICDSAQAMNVLLDDDSSPKMKYSHLDALCENFAFRLIPLADSKESLRKILQ